LATLRQIIVDTDSSYPGYDYNNLATAESTEQGDITLTSGSDEYVVFECYATSGTIDSQGSGTTIDGWTTEDGNYVEVNCLLDSSYGHRGKWDDSEYRITSINAGSNTVTVEQNYTRIIGLQITAVNVASAINIRCRASRENRIEKCIVRHDTAGGGGTGIYMSNNTGSGNNYASNNIIYDIGDDGDNNGMHGEDSTSGKAYFYNNTIVNCYTGIDTSAGDTIAINNIVNNCTDDFDGNFGSEAGYNVINTTSALGTFGSTHATGTATSYGANKLNDSGGGLSAAQVGSIVENDTDSTYSYVTVVDSDTQLTLADDIFDTGNEDYFVYTNMYGTVDFNAEESDDFTLNYFDEVAIFKGTNLYADSDLPVTDDVLGNSRGASTTDFFDVGAHHSLEYGKVVDTDSSYPGYDYTSLSSYESTEQADLTATGLYKTAIVECYATAGTADGTMAFDGWTTDPDNYVEVNGLLDPDYGHRGSWDTNEYRLEGTAGSSTLATTVEHFRVIGIQLLGNQTTDNRHIINMNSQADDTGEFIFSHNLIRGNGGSTYYQTGIDIEGGGLTNQVVKIHNNIFYDISAHASALCIYMTSSGTVYVYNNVLIGGNLGVDRNAGTTIQINNIYQDQTDRATDSTNDDTGYNIIEDGTLVANSLGGINTDLTTGTATSYGANQLNDSGGGLSAAIVGSVVANTTDSSYAYVTVVDSDTQLTLSSDAFDTGNEAYRVTSNIFGTPDFQPGNYFLTAEDTLAMFHGTNLYADANSPVTDDVLGNSRGSSSTDNFDIGAHHSLEYNRIVDPDSGAGFDYSSLNVWESNEETDLTAVGLYKASVATCRCTGGTADTDTFSIAGWTTESANYIKIWTDPTESYRHAGVYPTGNKYRFEYTGSAESVIIQEDHVRFEGIAFSTTLDTATQSLMALTGTVDLRIEKCILKDGGGAEECYAWFNDSLSAGEKIYFSNNITYDCFYGVRINAGDAGSVRCYNNTMVDCTRGFRLTGDWGIVINNISVGGADNFYGSTYNSLSGWNITDLDPDATSDGNFGADQKTGTTTGQATNKLIDSGGGLASIRIGSLVNAGVDWTYVTAIDSDIQLSINDDHFSTSEAYTIKENMYGNPVFNDEAGNDFTLNYLDTVAIFKGTNLYSGTELPITDDILGNSRGSVDTDNFDVGAHHSLEYGNVIDPDSGAGFDYTSLNTWESNEEADLQVSALNKASVAVCRCTGGTADTTVTSVDGWTTEAANYIKIWTDPTESYRHNGTWLTGNYYRYEITDAGIAGLNIRENYVRLKGLQIRTPSINDNSDHVIRVAIIDVSNDIRIEKCIIRGANNGTYTQNGISVADADAIVKIGNNIIYDINGTVANYCILDDGSGYIYNNTCIGGLYTIRGTSSSTLINNICDGAGTRSFFGQTTSNTGFNIVEEADTRTAYGSTWKTGTVTSGATDKLIDSGGGLSSIPIGSVVKDTSDTAYSYVTAVDSDIQLSLNDNIFAGTEDYSIFTNKVGTVDFEGSTYLLNYLDEVAIFEGTNLYTDSNHPIIDDILSNSRGASTTDFYDVGAHHSLEYGKVVDPDSGAGYDYTDLNTWESTEQGDLGTTGLYKASVACCRATSGGADDTSTGTVIQGWTTSSANYIKIWTDPAESYRHSGIWNTDYYRRISGDAHALTTDEDYIVFDGIQLSNIPVSNGKGLIEIRTVNSDNKIEIKNCVFKCNSNISYWQYSLRSMDLDSKAYVSNCLFFDGHKNASNQNVAIRVESDESWYIHNTTIIGSYYGIRRAIGTGTTYCKNILCNDQNSGTAFVETAGTLDLNYCASEDTTATAHGGTGNRASQTFTFVDSGIENYELDPKDDGGLLYGTNLYTDSNIAITDDVKGVSRGASTTDNFDIGAFYSDSVAHVIDPDSGAGYDYTDLNTWESTEQADLDATGLYKASIATCRCTGGTADSTAFTLDGWTSTTTNYIKMWTDPTESYRHNGTWQTGNKFRIEANSDVINILEACIRIEGLQIDSSPSSSATFREPITIPWSNTEASEIFISYCIVRNSNPADNNTGIFVGPNANPTAYIWNNIVYDFTGTTSRGIESNESTYLYNNTVHNCDIGIRRGSGTMVAKNNIVNDCITDYDGTFDSASTHNITDTTPASFIIFGANHATGTATSYGANKLNDSGGGLSAAQVGSIVENDTDSTYSYVTVVDSDTQLTLNDDIFDTGNETYTVKTNMFGSVTFQDEGSDDFTLNYFDEVAIFKGTNLYADSDLPVTDDVLGNSRGSAATDSYDVGAHHSLEYGKVVDPDSGAGFDYTSLNTWESTEQGDLTTATIGKACVAVCRSSSGGNDSSKVNINGWTTESVNYVKVQGERPTGASWDSSKWRIEITDDDPFDISEDYVRLDAVQFSKIYSSLDTFSACLGINGQTTSSNDIRISNSIIRCVPGATVRYMGIDIGDDDTNLTVWNTIIYGCPRRGIEFNGSILDLYNCTIEGSNTVDGVFANSGDIIIKNCAIWNNNDDIDVGAASSSTIDTCATDDGDGDNPITPANWADVFEDWTSNDYRLKSTDSDLRESGLTNPGSGLYDDDIIGTTRS
jgi:hypothetical protein